MYKKAKHNPSQYIKARNANALPAWADHDKIIKIYEECGYGYHVDHIIPLCSNLVCGLHVAENLQIIKGFDNLSKNNKFTSYSETKDGERIYLSFDPPKRFYTKKPAPITGLISPEYWEELENEKVRRREAGYGEIKGKYTEEFKKFKVRRRSRPYWGGMYPMPD